MRHTWKGPFIDFHTHLFPDRLGRAISAWFHKEGWRFSFEGNWREGAVFLEGVPGLERYVCFGYAHKPGIARELNDFYARIPEVSPRAVPLACVHQDDERMAELAHAALDAGCRGFKIHCQVQAVSPADPRFDPLYRVAEERGSFVLFHAGNGPFPGPHTGFDAFAPLLKRHPDLTCIAAHLGAFESERFLSAALNHENLYLDTAYTFIPTPRGRMDAPVELIEKAHGKILFATDFPGIVHPYEEGVNAVAVLPLSEKARRAIFHDNAARLLGPS
jgi:predicted TIM-barrel fold metal-dependent hydrolase